MTNESWKDMFELINAENPNDFVPLSDVEYYAAQIADLSELSEPECLAIASTFS